VDGRVKPGHDEDLDSKDRKPEYQQDQEDHDKHIEQKARDIG
jgi:hypothetical protein